jgi:hypothetical protein
MIYKGKEITKWSANDGFQCYDLTNICSAIKIKRTRSSSVCFTADEKVSDDERNKYNITTCRNYKNNQRVDNRKILITERGLKRLLCSSRSPESKEFAKFIGIDVYSYKYFQKETEFISAIIDAFPGEDFLLQYIPEGTNYRIDAYMPDYDLAIECDENDHNWKQEEDAQCQGEITDLLNCSWVRFSTDDPNFNIFKTIGEIYALIQSTNDII